MPLEPSTDYLDDKTTLRELLSAFWDGWRWILGIMLLSLSGAGAWLALTPAQYEAVGLIRLGDSVPSSLVDTVEYLEFATFHDRVLSDLGWGADGDHRGVVYRASPKVVAKRGSNLIELKRRGLTPEDAEAALVASVNTLAIQHRKTVQQTIDNIQLSLQQVQRESAEIKRALKDSEQMVRLRRQMEPRSDFSQILLYSQVMTAKQDRLVDLANKEEVLSKQIETINNNPTQLLTKPSVGKSSVYPKTHLVLILAGLGGGLLGVLVVFLRHSWQSRLKTREIF